MTHSYFTKFITQKLTNYKQKNNNFEVEHHLILFKKVHSKKISIDTYYGNRKMH
jgi:hypothetical protein